MNKEVKQKIIENLLKTIDKKLNKWYNNNCQGELNMDKEELVNEMHGLVDSLVDSIMFYHTDYDCSYEDIKQALCQAVMELNFDEDEDE